VSHALKIIKRFAFYSGSACSLSLTLHSNASRLLFKVLSLRDVYQNVYMNLIIKRNMK
jgi:hypothetical protein